MAGRKFQIQIVDDKDEVVIQFPVPTNVIHNGFGGGTDTPLPDYSENHQIKDLMTELKLKLGAPMPGESVTPPKQAPIAGYSSELCDGKGCDYVGHGRTQALAEANLKFHKKYKHSGAKVGSGQ